jgi:hypothetical protein
MAGYRKRRWSTGSVVSLSAGSESGIPCAHLLAGSAGFSVNWLAVGRAHVQAATPIGLGRPKSG